MAISSIETGGSSGVGSEISMWLSMKWQYRSEININNGVISINQM
jgi:hypothetical protein